MHIGYDEVERIFGTILNYSEGEAELRFRVEYSLNLTNLLSFYERIGELNVKAVGYRLHSDCFEIDTTTNGELEIIVRKQ